MDKYLLEILKSVNTIIIPGLGALTITDHDTGEIMFMSYLKHDDGKLTEYIVENEGFEELEAKNLIAKYVREIQLTLDKGESYDMYQFGSFYKNGDEIDFKNWDKNPSTFDKEISAPAVEKIETKEAEKPAKEEVQEEPSTKVTDKVEEPIEEPIAPAKEGPKKEVKKEPVVVHLKEEEAPKKEMNILEKEEKAKTAAKLDKLKKDKETTSEKKKRGVAFWMLMTLILLILAGGTYFGMNYDTLKQHVPFLADKETPMNNDNPVIEENESMNSTDDVVDDNRIEEDITEGDIEAEENLAVEEEAQPEVKREVQEVEQSVDNSGTDLPYHVIAGAFSSEENANRLGDKLRSEGYSVKVGPGRGMTLVSIKSFATRAEAQAAISGLSSAAPHAWVYKWD